MKEYKLATGHDGRPWHGTEFIDIQMQTLGLLQDFYSKPQLAAAITGFEVTGTDIGAGIAIIKHSTDGFKLVKFAGTTGVTFPYYVQCLSTNVNKQYPDLSNQISHTSYTLAGGHPPGTLPDLWLEVTADGATRWEDVYGASLRGAWQSVAVSLGSLGTISGVLESQRASLSDTLKLSGYVDIAYNWTGVLYKSVWALIAGSLPAPASDRVFSCGVDYDDTVGNLVQTANGSDLMAVTCKLTTSGELWVLVMKTNTEPYRICFNESVPLG